MLSVLLTAAGATHPS